jgi:Raf kinase inhibitor-like YbhB/YbcL family protein
MPRSERKQDAGGLSALLERVVGRWLRSRRAGDRHLFWHDRRLGNPPDTIRLTSPAFDEDEVMPQRYAGHGVGENVSPPLAWSVLPYGTAELVLVMQDPDVPLPRPVTHLLVIGIPPSQTGFAEGGLEAGAAGVRFGRGAFGRIGYEGPRPVRGHGRHRYVFQIFALSRPLRVDGVPDLRAVTKAMAGSVLARGRLIGTYERR